jgi:hypothetical protein
MEGKYGGNVNGLNKKVDWQCAGGTGKARSSEIAEELAVMN